MGGRISLAGLCCPRASPDPWQSKQNARKTPAVRSCKGCSLATDRTSASIDTIAVTPRNRTSSELVAKMGRKCGVRQRPRRPDRDFRGWLGLEPGLPGAGALHVPGGWPVGLFSHSIDSEPLQHPLGEALATPACE